MDSRPRLYLIPTPLGKTSANNSLPPDVIRVIHELDTFIVESLPSARKFLQWIEHPIPEYELKLYVLNKKSSAKETQELIEVILESGKAGMFSEAGAPAVADPGAELVRYAHHQDIIVHPLTGPSSIILALMASGGNGQQFTFHGYLPRKKQDRIKSITKIEESAGKDGYTHLFMETPYRSSDLWKDLLENLKPDTVLGYGQNLTLDSESTAAKEVMMWQGLQQEIPNDPTIFFLYRHILKYSSTRKSKGGKTRRWKK